MPKGRETVTLVCPPVKGAECIACGGPSEVLPGLSSLLRGNYYPQLQGWFSLLSLYLYQMFVSLDKRLFGFAGFFFQTLYEWKQNTYSFSCGSPSPASFFCRHGFFLRCDCSSFTASAAFHPLVWAQHTGSSLLMREMRNILFAFALSAICLSPFLPYPLFSCCKLPRWESPLMHTREPQMPSN